MSVGRLLLAVLLVALVSSCASSLISVAMEAHSRSGGASYSASVYVATMVIVAVISFFILLAALLAGALPLTIMLDRIGVPALGRDAILATAGTGLAALVVPAFGPAFLSDVTVDFTFGLVTSLFWILALHLFGGRKTTEPMGVPQ